MFVVLIPDLDIEKKESKFDLIYKFISDPIYLLIIGIFIGIILSYLFIKLSRQRRYVESSFIPEDSPKYDENFKDLFQNINDSEKCKKLYKSLMTKVHPDRFSGTDKERRALELSQELGKFKFNYQKLKEIENIINSEIYNSL